MTKKLIEQNKNQKQKSSDTLLLLALEEQKKGHTEKAEQLINELLKVKPNDPTTYKNAATFFEMIKKYDASTTYYEKYLSLNSEDADTTYRLAKLFFRKNDVKKAGEYLEKTIKLKPNHTKPRLELAELLEKLGQSKQALQCIEKAYQLAPKNIQILMNAAIIAANLKRYDEAIRYLHQAIKIKPDLPEAYSNMGIITMLKNDDHREAIRQYRKALQLNKNYQPVYKNIGSTLQSLGKYKSAIAFYKKAIAINNKGSNTHFELGITLLRLGHFQQGWEEYEWRLKMRLHFDPKTFPIQFFWKGENLKGKTIILICEQGIGDTLQFIRYAQLIKKNECHIILQARTELINLLSKISWIDKVITITDPIPPFDYFCPLLSLPRLFKTDLTSIPADIPYIEIDPTLRTKWKKLIPHKKKLQIGIVWAGNPEYIHDKKRSCSLKCFSSLLDISNTIFYSLQKDEPTKELIKHNEKNKIKIINLDPHLKDFTDTTAAIEQLDLIISIDTAIAHLAGAIGKPVWTLLSYVADWRWLTDREDSPWYPTMRLFRQKRMENWKNVFERVKEALENL